jgi:hypothetical protein
MTDLLGLTTAPRDSAYFPSWAHGGSMRYYDRSMAHGEWTKDSGPPYVKHITMWSDPKCVDHTGPANNVRRILGLKTSWHTHRWNTNQYMSKMNSVQLRFLSRNQNSILVIPPFHQFPSVSTRAMAMLNDYVLVGGNTIVIIGGPPGLLFINQVSPAMTETRNSKPGILNPEPETLNPKPETRNQNMAGTDGYGYDLEPKWVEGPYEMQV